MLELLPFKRLLGLLKSSLWPSFESFATALTLFVRLFTNPSKMFDLGNKKFDFDYWGVTGYDD